MNICWKGEKWFITADFLFGFSIRMRDLSNHEKQEVQRLTKANEKNLTEITNLKKEKERFASEVEDLSQQMIDLKEQVRWVHV